MKCKMKGISVVCTTFNDQLEIINLLDDISQQNLQPDEIVIADGGSKDDTIRMIEDYKGKVNIPITVLSGKKLNISEGLNTAIKNTHYPLIAIVGTGNRYDSSYLLKLWDELLSSSVDVVFAPIRGKDSTPFSKLYNRAFLSGAKGNRIPSNHGGLVKKNVFRRIGLFYEKFVYAGEDAEFYERVKKNKIPVSCAEDAYLEWDVPENMIQFKKQIKNYTIATMQITDNNYALLKTYRKNYVQLIASLAIIISILLKQFLLPAIIAVMAMVYFLAKHKRKRIAITLLSQYRQWYQLITIVSNIKYLKQEYKLDSSIIRELK